MLSEVIRLFEAWTVEQNLLERTERACRQCLQNYAADGAEYQGTDPNCVEGYPLSSFVLKLEKQSLTINGANHNYPYIDNRLGLYLPDPDNQSSSYQSCIYDGLRYVGYYRLIVTADGADCDDYLVFEDDFLPNETKPV